MQELTGWEVAKGLWAALVSLLAFLGLRQVKRIDALEEDCIGRPDHDREVDRIREEQRRVTTEVKEQLKEHRQETQESFARVFRRLDEIADRVRERP